MHTERRVNLSVPLCQGYGAGGRGGGEMVCACVSISACVSVELWGLDLCCVCPWVIRSWECSWSMWHGRGPHTHAHTQSVSEAVSPVPQMVVWINLKLSWATAAPPTHPSVCLSVQFSVIFQAELDKCVPLHISISHFSFFIVFIVFFPLCCLFLHTLLWTRNLGIMKYSTFLWYRWKRDDIWMESFVSHEERIRTLSSSLSSTLFVFSLSLPLSLSLHPFYSPWGATDRPSHYPWSLWQHHGWKSRVGEALKWCDGRKRGGRRKEY